MAIDGKVWLFRDSLRCRHASEPRHVRIVGIEGAGEGHSRVDCRSLSCSGLMETETLNRKMLRRRPRFLSDARFKVSFVITFVECIWRSSRKGSPSHSSLKKWPTSAMVEGFPPFSLPCFCYSVIHSNLNLKTIFPAQRD